ncbi:MAG: 2-dehydropantoate 2-reductase [Deltaproteobacteria bacterium]|nr:2-dehydropantoate 2-reductase [Deltaproteobacteria bacterium]
MADGLFTKPSIFKEILMNFLVVGPGAMGCLFAARLKNAGYDVTLLDHVKERADAIDKQGIMVEGISGEYTVNVPAVCGDIPFQPDFALISVKANNTREAGLAIRSLISHKTIVVTLQNGVGNLEVLEETFGRERVLGGVTAEGATLLGWGRIRHAGQGATVIGPKGGTDSPAKRLVSALNKAGFDAKSTDNVNDLIWGKLIINVGINALTAITGLKNGRLPELDGTRLIMVNSRGKTDPSPLSEPNRPSDRGMPCHCRKYRVHAAGRP